MANAPEPPNGMEYCLNRIGFGEELATKLLEEGFGSFDEVKTMSEEDFHQSLETLSKRPTAVTRVIVPIGLSRKLKSLILWIQDYFRCGLRPQINELSDEALDEALERAQDRKVERSQLETITKTLVPEKFQYDKNWDKWHKSLRTYLAALPGSNGVPLIYVIRANEDPPNGQTFTTYNEKAIAYAPLNGIAFQNDARKVHFILTALVQGGPGEQFLTPIARLQNGRRDMQALYAHFAGKGNYNRQMATVDKLRATLHYKSERAMPFISFLQKLQYMFQLCDEQDETMSEQAKIRELLAKCQSCQFMNNAIATLKFESQRGNLTFQAAVNHLQTLVSETQTVAATTRNISAYTTSGYNNPRKGERGGRTSTRGGRGRGRGGRSSGRRSPDTGYRTAEEWSSLSGPEKDAIRAARSRKGVTGGAKSGHPSATKRIQELTSQRDELNREISKLSSNSESTGNNTSEANSRSVSTVSWGSTSASAFGGKSTVIDRKRGDNKE